jgi:Spy/CpxP family protein refolding chaperone
VPAARAQQPDSTGADDPDVAALRQEFRQRWHEHIRQTLGLTDAQASKVQATEDRFEQQRVQYRGQIRDINRQLNGEMLSGTPNNDRVNQLIQQRQENRLRMEQLNRDEDGEMAGYLSPLQRVRYQQERGRLINIIQETIRHRRAGGAGGGLGPRRGGAGGQPGQGGRPRRRPRP